MTKRPNPTVMVVIPARGGSRGIPRKNLRSLHGRPLIAYSIETALRSSFSPSVVVSSDDDEILSVAQALGATPHRRPAGLSHDSATLDGVVFDAYAAANDRLGYSPDVVVTMQPTSPLVATSTVDRAIERLLSQAHVDTVLTVSDDRHLRWVESDRGIVPAYAARLNRQHLPGTYRETGGVFATRASALRPTNRIGGAVDVIEVHGGEAIDIDGVDDWALCEWYLGRREVLFVVTGNAKVGLGHAHNALAVADALTRHRIRFLVDRDSELAARMIETTNYEVIVQSREALADDVNALAPDLVINDILDTSVEYVRALKHAGRLVVNFEDLGPGASHADLVINAIYPEQQRGANHYFGHRYYCPRPEFIVSPAEPVRDDVKTVLLTFGGADPSNLTARVLRVIGSEAARNGTTIRVILGLAYQHSLPVDLPDNVEILHSVPNIAAHMRDADIAFTSAGRTTFELACVGTPTIVIAQNDRELTHLFASDDNGFVNLGLASRVSDAAIGAAYHQLAESAVVRRELQRRLTRDNLSSGLERVRLLIEELMTG